MKYRWESSLLLFFTLFLGVTFYVTIYVISTYSELETKAIADKIEYTVRITADNYNGESQCNSLNLIDEHEVKNLLIQENISFRYLSAYLIKVIKWRNELIEVTGVHRINSTLSNSTTLFQVPKQKVIVGKYLATKFNLQPGNTISVRGADFRIETVLQECGTIDDRTLFLNLADAQKVFRMEKKITELRAIDCTLAKVDNTSKLSSFDEIRATIQTVLPNVSASRIESVARVRNSQLQLITNYRSFLLSFFSLFTFVLFFILQFMAMKSRMNELALFKALGFPFRFVLSAFIGKTLILGIISVFVGYWFGHYLGVEESKHLFSLVNMTSIVHTQLFYRIIVCVPLLSVFVTAFVFSWAMSQPTQKLLNFNR